MEAQEIFDTVVNHLRTQGHKAKNYADIACVYRARDGSKCAGGILINDEEYNPKMEKHLFDKVLNYYGPISLKERLLPHIELIMRLQSIHDTSEVKDWEQGFKNCAEDFNLIYTSKVS